MPLPSLGFAARAARCHAVRAAIHPLVQWEPLESPREGYTIILACNAPLAGMLPLQLELLDRQEREGLQGLVIVFDCPVEALGRGVEHEARTRWPGLPMQFVYYTSEQERRLKRIAWSKCYSWLSWCLALSHVQTRHAVLHDFDAFPLAPGFFAQRYRLMRQREVEYLGIQPYIVNGYRVEEQFAATWELMFDAAFFRCKFSPIDVFPRPRLVSGRWLTLDTFHDAQHRAGARAIEPASTEEEAVVHATQMICQATHLVQSERYAAPANATIMLAPYLLWASGDSNAMRCVEAAGDHHRRHVGLLGKTVDLAAMTHDRVHGLRQMARTIDRALVGRVRGEVESYFDALDRLCGSCEPAARKAA